MYSSFEKQVMQEFDIRAFFPVAECAVCDEPTEIVYTCSSCGASLCPGCVCSNADKKTDSCPDCPGACIRWDPDPVGRN